MSKEKMMKRLAYLMDKHRVLDKKVTEDYKQMVSDAIVQQDKFENVCIAHADSCAHMLASLLRVFFSLASLLRFLIARPDADFRLK